MTASHLSFTLLVYPVLRSCLYQNHAKAALTSYQSVLLACGHYLKYLGCVYLL